MANENVLFGPGADPEEAAIRQRLQYAQTLRQSQTPLQGRMVGDRFVGASPLEGLANMLKTYGGRVGEEQAMQQAGALNERRRAETGVEAGQIATLLRGKPAEYRQSMGDMGEIDPSLAGMGPVNEQSAPAVAPDANAALAKALASRNPMIQQMGGTIMAQQLTPKNVVVGRSLVNQNTGQVVGTDATWQAEQNAAREAKAAELRTRIEDQRTSREERADLQRELAKMRMDGQKELRAIAAGTASAGKVPPGYRMTPEGNLQAIPGGPADQKISGQFNADTAALTGSVASFDRLAAAANEVLNHPGLKGITGIQGKLPNVPGGPAANAEALLGTLKSQVGFGVLQDMRNNSKTGGALGSVSDAEGKRLEANLAALDKSQSIEQFQANLKKIVEYSEGAKGRMREAYNLRHADRPSSPASAPPAPPAPVQPASSGFKILEVK